MLSWEENSPAGLPQSCAVRSTLAMADWAIGRTARALSENRVLLCTPVSRFAGFLS